MKILIIDLLRLGDCIMTVPVINGLKAARRDSQIDMLTFAPSAVLHAMLPSVTNWWTLDRDTLQAGLGEADIPMLTSYSVLQERLDEIGAQEYDLVINLSQTNFSAWIAGYLKCSDRLGLTFDVKGLPHFYSPWFRYLNDQPENADDIFHYTDIFCHACGLEGSGRLWDMQVPATAKSEVDALGLQPDGVCVFQLFTSDVKKDWPVANWLEMSVRVVNERPGLQLVALCAPNEKARATEFVEAAAARGVKITLAVLSIPGALELLKRSQLLVSGDTSIKHLANAAQTRVLELCVGWSDWRRTGIYKANSLILQGKDSSIESQTAAHAALSLLNDNWDRIAQIAREVSGVRVLRTRQLDMGFWFAEPLGVEEDQVIMETLIERGAWKLSLSRGRRREVMEFGSAGMNLRRDLKQIFTGKADSSVMAHLEFLDKEETKAVQEASSRLNLLKRERPARLNDLVEIAAHRRVQIGMEAEYEHSEFKTKLIRVLKSHWTEMI